MKTWWDHNSVGLAAKSSLQHPYEAQIISAVQVQECVQKNISGILFTCTTQEDLIKSEKFEVVSNN